MTNQTTSFVPAPDGTYVQTIVITGANSGIGFEAARVLAERGARLIMAVRRLDAGEEAAAAIVGAGLVVGGVAAVLQGAPITTFDLDEYAFEVAECDICGPQPRRNVGEESDPVVIRQVVLRVVGADHHVADRGDADTHGRLVGFRLGFWYWFGRKAPSSFVRRSATL